MAWQVELDRGGRLRGKGRDLEAAVSEESGGCGQGRVLEGPCDRVAARLYPPPHQASTRREPKTDGTGPKEWTMNKTNRIIEML